MNKNLTSSDARSQFMLGESIMLHAPRMRECSIEMNDGTVITARYATNKQLRIAIAELIRMLETHADA